MEHSGAAELGDDEVVGEVGVAKGFRVRIRVLEELESEFWIILEAKKRGESERRDGFWRIHFSKSSETQSLELKILGCFCPATTRQPNNNNRFSILENNRYVSWHAANEFLRIIL